MEADPRMTGHVKKLWPELDDLFATGDEVAAVTNSAGWAAVVRVLEREVAEVGRRLDHGDEPKTQAEYALAHGRLGGLVAMHEAAQAILAVSSRRLAEQREKHERDAEPSLKG